MSENDRVFRRVSQMSDPSRLGMAVAVAVLLLDAAVLGLMMMNVTRALMVHIGHNVIMMTIAFCHTFALVVITARVGNNASNEGCEEHGDSKKLHGSFQVRDFWNGKQKYDNGVDQLKLNGG